MLYTALFIILRYLFTTSYIFNNDEILSFRMVNDFKLYFIKDIHLFVYDYIITLIIGVFTDNNILFFRLFNIFISLGSVFFLYKIALKEFGEKRSILLLIILIFSPFFLFYNIYIENYNFSLFLISLLLYIERFNKRGFTARFLIVLIAGYTHYFNIIFLFIFYNIDLFYKKIQFKKIVLYFTPFIPLVLLVIYKYMNGYDNSILIDFNSNLLARFELNSFFAVFSWIIFGIKSNSYMLKIIVLLFSFYFIFSSMKEKSYFLRKLYILSIFYTLFIICITIYADNKFNASSFNSDYLLIIYPVIIFFILSKINKRNILLITVVILILFNYSNFIFYKEVQKINFDFNKMNYFIKNNDVGFLVNSTVTSEKNSSTFIDVIFNRDSQKINNIVKKNDYFIIPQYFEKDILYNLDKKILTGDEKYIYFIEEQAKEIKSNLFDYDFVENKKVGDDIYLVYKKSN